MVVYRNAKPQDIERTEKVVLIGNYKGDHFEASSILSKCPSKYNEELSKENLGR
jgi:cytochrome c-type biogenesis protein CcmE